MSESLEDKQTNPSQVVTIPIIEAVRRRPGMYIGSTDYHGLHEMLWEVVAHSLNDHLAGSVDRIAIRLDADGSITVADNGLSMAVDAGSDTKSALERALTEEYRRETRADVYKVAPLSFSGDMLFVANALSSRLVAEVKRDGHVWRQEYKQGVPQTNMVRLELEPTTDTGAAITFWPDTAVFKDAHVDLDLLIERVRMTCYLNSRLTMEVIDARYEQEHVHAFHFPNGVRSYVQSLTGIRREVHRPISISAMVGTTRIDVALQFNDDNVTSILPFVNNYHAFGGGPHLVGFYLVLIRVLNNFGRVTRDGSSLLQDDSSTIHIHNVRIGLSAVISIWLLDPQLENATLSRLHNPEVKEQVAVAVMEGLMRHFEHMPEDLDRIVRHLTGGNLIQRYTTPLTRDEQAAWDEFRGAASADA